jgi:hypothetical protein
MTFRVANVILLLVLFSQFAFAQKKGAGSDILDRNVRVDIQKGTFYLLDNAPLNVSNFKGVIRPTEKDGSDLIVESGQAFLSSNTLTQIMNQQLQGQDKLEDLKFSTSGEKVKIQGKAKTGIIPIPFTLTGSVKTTPDGKVLIHSTSVEAAKIPVKDVMDLFGIDVKDVTGKIQQRAISLQGNTLILSPDKLSNKLRLRGKVSKVEVQKDGLLLTFGSTPSSSQQSQAKAPSATR